MFYQKLSKIGNPVPNIVSDFGICIKIIWSGLHLVSTFGWLKWQSNRTKCFVQWFSFIGLLVINIKGIYAYIDLAIDFYEVLIDSI